jgi:hypothetical protein
VSETFSAPARPNEIFHDVVNSFEEDPTTGLVLLTKQEITDDFLDHCKAARDGSHERAGEYHQVASVPTSVAELWLKQGFDIYREPAKAILKRLRDQQLDAFITTNKRV